MAHKFIGHMNSVCCMREGGEEEEACVVVVAYNVHTIWPLCTAINAVWLHSIKSPGFSGR